MVPSFVLSDNFDFATSGFMELVGIQELGPTTSLFDDMFPIQLSPILPEVSLPEAMNALNSSSVSASSPESTANDHEKKQGKENTATPAEEDPEDQDTRVTTTKEVKGRKKKGKRERAERIAFMTKSKDELIDDGYRWRKYGQKAVKNSPFPRSYYRCTSVGCSVKKRVERWSEDPLMVINTYEGRHFHLPYLPPEPSY